MWSQLWRKLSLCKTIKCPEKVATTFFEKLQKPSSKLKASNWNLFVDIWETRTNLTLSEREICINQKLPKCCPRLEYRIRRKSGPAARYSWSGLKGIVSLRITFDTFIPHPRPPLQNVIIDKMLHFVLEETIIRILIKNKKYILKMQ